MAYEIYTGDWARAWCGALNDSEAYAEAASDWEGALVLRVRADTSYGIEEPRSVWVDLHHGDCRGARAATLGYKGYPKSCCVSINEVICHGIPGERVLARGDVVNVDVTSVLDGYYGDASNMYLVGEVSEEARKLVDVTRECLWRGIEVVRPGARVGDIGHAIQTHAEGHGYSVVRDFVGHGVGLRFHEPPQVPHFGDPGTGPELRPGMVFTIEPMINAGGAEGEILDDGWTAVTRDRSLSAQWEHTVAVTEDGVEVLTE